MEIRKYLKISENDERKINEFLAQYPPLDESELLELVKKELPSPNIVRVFCSIISKNWKSLQKTNLVCTDIVLHLEDKGFYGARVDKYLLGLILNHLYKENLSIAQIKDLIERIDNYLKGNDRTFSKFIQNVKLFIEKKKLNVPIETLQKKATLEIEELEKDIERLRRLKTYDNRAMENI